MPDDQDNTTNTPSEPKLSPILLPPRDGIDFESLPWNLNHPESHNYIHITTTSTWEESHYDPKTDDGSVTTSIYSYSSSPLSLHPATTSLNYGTTIWEGLKCFRTSKNRAAVFRPDMNYKRICNGAMAMCLPVPSYDLFMKGVQAAAQANADLIPPFGEGMKLYIRPILIGSGQQLGLYPSAEFSLIFYVSPTGNYFKGKAMGGLKLHLETTYGRAARGGTGNVKCSGNYGVCLRPLKKAKEQGFDDNLYLDLETYKKGNLGEAIVQELSAANVFLVLKSGQIVTPSLERGTILPGVTRDTILEIAREYKVEIEPCLRESIGDDNANLTVVERDVKVKDFMEATEAFVTGTAAEVVPIQSLKTGKDEEGFETVLKYGKDIKGGPVTSKLLSLLREIMAEKRDITERTKGWLPDPFRSAEDFRTLKY